MYGNQPTAADYAYEDARQASNVARDLAERVKTIELALKFAGIDLNVERLQNLERLQEVNETIATLENASPEWLETTRRDGKTDLDRFYEERSSLL